jgi:hypothetical protein
MSGHLQHLTFHELERREVVLSRGDVTQAISEETAARIAGLEALITTISAVGPDLVTALLDYVALAGLVKARTVVRNVEETSAQAFDRR